MDADDLLHSRFHDARPGRELIAIETVAIPVSTVAAEVLVQEKKPLPLLNEFVLRLTSAGLDTIEDLAAITGMQPALVLEAIANEVQSGNMVYAPSTRRFGLTVRGVESCRTLEAIQPAEKLLPLTFDRMLWRLADYPREQLMSKREVQESGFLKLPAMKSSRLSSDDVSASDVNGLFRYSPNLNGSVEVLAVRRLKGAHHHFLPVKMLIYGESNSPELDLALVVDHELSPKHDAVLVQKGGASHLGLRTTPPAERVTLDPLLEARRVENRSEQAAAPGANPASPPQVRSISVFEHTSLLQEALETASRRLLIISPWVRSAVVSTKFGRQLERRLRSGCQVTVAHGYGIDDRGSDGAAIDRLQDLANRFENMHLYRMRNTHAKILIFDDSWVTTSFNWLSFRGDPDRTYRMEEGTLVSMAGEVDAAYGHYREMVIAQCSAGGINAS